MKGLTLIEVVVVIALLGIIGTIVYSMDVFGIKAFGKSSDKYSLISETNLASEYITKNIRFAYGVEILDKDDTIPASSTIATSANPNSAYIFISRSSGESIINYRDKTGTKEIGRFTTCSVIFNRSDNNKAISFNIVSTYKNENYSVNSGVVPVNLLIQKNSDIVDNTGTEDGIAIKLLNNAMVSSDGNLTFNPSNPPDGTLGTSYVSSYSLTASGGTEPYAFALTNNTRLPYGMILSSDGKLSGTPVEAGTFSVGIFAYDKSTPAKTAINLIVIKIANTVSVNNDAPVVMNVNITGSAIVGGTLTIEYNYSDPSGHAESGTEYVWYKGSYANGTDMTVVPGATSSSYKVTDTSDISKYYFVKVIPRSTNSSEGAGAAVFCGFPVQIKADSANTAPYIDGNAYITASKPNNLRSGDKLTASYSYRDNDGDLEGATKFKWYRGSKDDGSDKQLIIEGPYKEYILTGADANMYIFFEVTPVAATGLIEGNSVLSTNIGPVKK